MRTVNHHRPQKGYVVVLVGSVNEEQRRIKIPVEHLNHPNFELLLEEAERTYGYKREGAIALPCSVEQFRLVQELIERENGQHQRRQSSHLPRFAGCFRT